MNDRPWAPIQDLPTSWSHLASDELASLSPIWREQSRKLQDSGALQAFNARLGRAWAIETGIIENLYSIDRGVTQILIERGIEASLIPHGSTDRPGEEIVAILGDHADVLDGLFDFVAQRRTLSTSYIKELHQGLLRSQDTASAVNGGGRVIAVELLRGEWKQLPNNPTRPDGQIHEYCPPEHVASEIDRLVAWHQEHTESNVPPEVEAAWLHHGFAQIHPFQDGNGRLARALASLIFLRAGWFPLVVDRDNRERYIETLELADTGDLRPLVGLFSSIEKKAFLRALNLSEDVLKGQEPIGQVIRAATERLRTRQEGRIKEQRKVFDLAERLRVVTAQKLSEIAENISRELKGVRQNYWSSVDQSDGDKRLWFKKQIVEVARSANYFADTRTYGAWVRLKVIEERQAELVVSFHSLGVEFLGIVAASAFLEFRDRGADGEVSVEGPYSLLPEIYQCSFNDDPDLAQSRFETWLNDVIVSGLDRWRRQI